MVDRYPIFKFKIRFPTVEGIAHVFLAQFSARRHVLLPQALVHICSRKHGWLCVSQRGCPAGMPGRKETALSGCAGSSALRSEACTWLARHALLPPSQTKESPASAPSQRCSQTSMVLSAALK